MSCGSWKREWGNFAASTQKTRIGAYRNQRKEIRRGGQYNAVQSASRDQPMVASRGRAIDEYGPWHALRMECVRGSARTTIRVETRRHLDGVHDRRHGLCAYLRRSEEHTSE